MKMKMKSLALACALACASQAYALTPSTTPDVAMFMSGSSALQNAVNQISSDLFVAGTVNVFFDGSATVPNGSSYRAYFGTMRTGTTSTGLPIPASLAGKKVLIYNTAAGGSIKGVNPVALAQAVTRLDISTCVLSSPAVIDTFTGTTVYTCPGTVTTAVPDAGVSDVEPALNVGINLTINPATALTTRTPTATALNAAQFANLTAISAMGTPMGIVVNGSTGPSPATAAMLTLSKAQASALMSGTSVYDWNQIDSSIPAGSTSIIVCRRQQGSGTQSTINAALFGFPCSSSSLLPATAAATTATLGSTSPLPGGNYVVVENNSSGFVAACMTAAQNGTAAGKAIDVTSGATVNAGDPNSVVLPAGGYAIGLVSFDRPAKAGELYQFASINGAAPTLDNATTGKYDIVVESVFTRRVATTAGIPPLSGTQLDLFNTFAAAGGNPAVLGTPGHIVPGVAALTENGWIAPAVFNPNNPVMKVGNGGNTCTPLQQLQ
jgi:hypothetical protein